MPHINILLSDLRDNEPFRTKLDGFAVVAFRRGDDVFAYEDVCPHAFWPLSGGELRDGVIECNGHAWEFDVQTGRCLNAPAYCLNAIAVTRYHDHVSLSWDADHKSLQPRRTQSANHVIATTA